MAKSKHQDDDSNGGGKKQKTFRVLFNNGKEIEVKAERFQVIADDFQIHFYDEHGVAMQDAFIARAEVAAIIPA